MSQENVDAFYKGLEAYNRRDVEAMVAVSHPDIEWYPLSAQVEGDESFRGHGGLRKWWANMEATWEAIEASIDEVRDLEDATLAFGRLRGRWRSGVPVDAEVAWVYRFRDGLAIWGRVYTRREDALEAVGLSE
jgi:ketosteroid isomerase-like protein